MCVNFYFIKKTISVIVLITFTWTNILYATPLPFKKRLTNSLRIPMTFSKDGDKERVDLTMKNIQNRSPLSSFRSPFSQIVQIVRNIYGFSVARWADVRTVTLLIRKYPALVLLFPVFIGLPCDRMYYRERLARQWAIEADKGKDRELTEEEMNEAGEELARQVQEMGELLDGFSEELAGDEELNTELSDQEKHDIRDVTIRSLTRYLRSGKKDKSFEEFVSSLRIDPGFRKVFSYDSEDSIRRALQKEDVTDTLRAIYDKGTENIHAIEGADEGDSHVLSESERRRLSFLQALMNRMGLTGHQHHHGMGGTHMQTLFWILPGLGILWAILSRAFSFDIPGDSLYLGALGDNSYLGVLPAAIVNGMGSGGEGGLPGLEEVGDEYRINAYTNDLNELAKAGRIDDTYYLERDARIIDNQIGVRGANNVVIVGDPEVGEGLIEAIVVRAQEQRTQLTNLKGSKFLEFNTARFVDKLAIPGQLEEEIRNLIFSIKNVYKNERVVLVFNFQDFYRIGEMKGRMMSSLSFLLQEALTAENISVLGIANEIVYEELFRKDKRLEQVFGVDMLRSPPPYDMQRIVRQFVRRITAAYRDLIPEGVRFSVSREAIDQAIELAQKYYPSGTPPNKLQEIFDKIITDKLLKSGRLKSELIESGERLLEAGQGLRTAILRNNEAEGDFLKGVIDRELTVYEDIMRRIEEQDTFLEGIKEQGRWEIAVEDIAERIAEDSGVPLYAIMTTEDEKLTSYVDSIRTMLIGQDHAIEETYRSFNRRRERGERGNEPIGSFVLVGPTGVGKTEFAKSITRHMFGSEDALVRFDMSEYMNPMDHYKLTGAPPGYIGYEAGGQLTNHILKRPYSVVLFDEIEKAHPEVFDLFLQILAEGELVDNHGRTANFKNTIILMTSNLGFSQAALADTNEAARIDEILQQLDREEDKVTKATDEESKQELRKARNFLLQLIEDIGREEEQAYYLADGVREIQQVLNIEGEEERRKLLLSRARQAKTNWQHYKGLDIETLYKTMAEIKYSAWDEEDNEGLKTLVERELKARRGVAELSLEQLVDKTSAEYDIELERFKELDEILANEDLDARRQYLISDIRKSIRVKLEQSIKNQFRPEFINRVGIDNIIAFEPLSKDTLQKILYIKIREYDALLAEAGYAGLVLSDDVRKEIIAQGYDVVNGARPMIRALKRIVIAPLSAAILKGQFEKGDKVTVLFEDGEVAFDAVKEEKEKALYQHQDIISELETILSRNEGFDEELVERVMNLSLKPEAEESTAQTDEQLEEFKERFSISLPMPEDLEEEMKELDQSEIEKRISELDEKLNLYNENLRKYERDLRAASSDAQRQAINLRIDNEREKVQLVERQKEQLQLMKEGRLESARQAFDEEKRARIEAIKQAEREINDIFENLTIESAEGLVEDIHPPVEAVLGIASVLKQKRRNYPFVLSESLLIQRSLVDSFAKRAQQRTISGFGNTRVLRLKLESLKSYFSLIGYFEARIKEIADVIEEDDKQKGINTIIVMDFEDAKDELERIRVNPFLLGFFLRMFKGLASVSFIMTTSDSNISAEESFDKYFSLIELGEEERDSIFENFSLFVREDVEKKNNGNGSVEKIEIGFNAIDMAVRIWEKYFSGRPAMETLIKWFNTVSTNKQHQKDRVEGEIQEAMDKLVYEFQELLDTQDADLTAEDLLNNKDILSFIRRIGQLKEEKKEATSNIIEAQDILSYVVEREEEEGAREIDASLMEGSEREKILALEAALKARIVGQDEAVTAISNAVKIAKSGLKPSHQPIGSFIFAGPTGVGKTQLAKTLADNLGMNLYRIDMSDFKNRGDLSKLIGAPPGFVGFDTKGGEGILIEQLKKYPNTVIVFDEIEKGDPQILDILLQILEDGGLTSNQGRTVSFKDAIIILTSNIGVEDKAMINGRLQTTFSIYPEMEEVLQSRDPERLEEFKEKMTARVKASFKRFFRPEFLNRIDAQIVFNPLSYEFLHEVVAIFLNQEVSSLEERQRIQIEIGSSEEEKKALHELLIEKGYRAEYGARPLDEAVKRLFTDPFIEFKNERSRTINEGDTIAAKRDGEKIVFELRSKEQEQKLDVELSADEELLLSHIVEELNSRKGEELSFDDMEEMLDLRLEVKPQEGKDPQIALVSTSFTTTNNNFQRRDPEVNTKISEIEVMPQQIKELVIDWTREAVRAAKMANVESFIWETDRVRIENFDSLVGGELKEKIASYLKSMGEEKAVTLHWGWREGEEVLVVGVKYSSKLTRKLKRAIFERSFDDETEMRLATERSLQGLLAAKMKLEALGAEMNFSQDEEGTLLWLAVPARRFEPAQAAPDGSNALQEQERLQRELDELRKERERLEAQKIKAPEEPAVYSIADPDTYLKSLKLDRILEGHEGWVFSAIPIEINGTAYIVSGGDDNTIRIWDFDTGEEIKRLEGHEAWVSSVTPIEIDGKTYIVSGSTDSTIRIWDFVRGVEIKKLEGEGYGRHLWSVTPIEIDGKTYIVSGSEDGIIKIWDFDTEEEIKRLKGDGGRVFSLAPIEIDGKTYIVSGSEDGIIRIWDFARSVEVKKLRGHSSWVWSVTPIEIDGTAYIISGSHDSTIRIWDFDTGKEIRRLEGHEAWVRSVTPIEIDGKTYIISGGDDGNIRIWDFYTGVEIKELECHGGRVWSVTPIEIDGKTYIISGGDDGTIRIWKGDEGIALWTGETFDSLNTQIRTLEARLTALQEQERVEGELLILEEQEKELKRQKEELETQIKEIEKENPSDKIGRYKFSTKIPGVETRAVGVDSQGRIYIADADSNQITVTNISLDDNALASGGTISVRGPRLDSRPMRAEKLAFDSKDNIYALGPLGYMEYRTVYILDPAGRPTERELKQPRVSGEVGRCDFKSIAIDQLDRVFIYDFRMESIHLFDSEGEFLKSWEKPESLEFTSLAISKDNRLLVGTYKGQILIVDVDIENSDFRMVGTIEPPEPASIKAIVVDVIGNIYVLQGVDRTPNITVFDPDGQYLGYFTGPKNVAYLDMAIDKKGYLFFPKGQDGIDVYDISQIEVLGQLKSLQEQLSSLMPQLSTLQEEIQRLREELSQAQALTGVQANLPATPEPVLVPAETIDLMGLQEAKAATEQRERLRKLIASKLPSLEDLNKMLEVENVENVENSSPIHWYAIVGLGLLGQEQEAAVRILLSRLEKETSLVERSDILDTLAYLRSQGVRIEVLFLDQLKQNLIARDWKTRRFAAVQLRFAEERKEAAMQALWDCLDKEKVLRVRFDILSSLTYLMNQGVDIKVDSLISLERLRKLLNKEDGLQMRYLEAVLLGFVKEEEQAEAARILLERLEKETDSEEVRTAIIDSLVYLRQKGVRIESPSSDPTIRNFMAGNRERIDPAADQFKLSGEISSLEELERDLDDVRNMDRAYLAAVQLGFVKKEERIEAARILLDKLVELLSQMVERQESFDRNLFDAIRDSLRYISSQVEADTREETQQAKQAGESGDLIDVELLSTLPKSSEVKDEKENKGNGKFLAVDPYDNGQLISISGKGIIEFWDIRNPKEPKLNAQFDKSDIRSWTVERYRSSLTWAIAISQGKILLASEDTGNLNMQLWSIDESRELQELFSSGRKESFSLDNDVEVLLSNDMRLLIVAERTFQGSRGVSIFDITNPSQPQKLTAFNWDKRGEKRRGAIYDMALSEDKTLLALGYFAEGMQLWDIAEPTRPQLLADIRSGDTFLSLSPDKTLLVSGTLKGTIHIRDIKDPKNPQLLAALDESKGGHEDGSWSWVTSLCLSLDKTVLVSGGRDCTIRIWDIKDPRNPQLLATLDESKGGHRNGICSLSLSSDKTLLISSDDYGSVKIWRLGLDDLSFQSGQDRIESLQIAKQTLESIKGSQLNNLGGLDILKFKVIIVPEESSQEDRLIWLEYNYREQLQQFRDYVRVFELRVAPDVTGIELLEFVLRRGFSDENIRGRVKEGFFNEGMKKKIEEKLKELRQIRDEVKAPADDFITQLSQDTEYIDKVREAFKDKEEWVLSTIIQNQPEYYGFVLSRIKEYLGDISGKRMLEAGCGPGNIVYLMKEYLNTEISGLEAEERFVDFAKENDIPVVEGNLLNPSQGLVDKAPFDLIFSNDVLDGLVDESGSLIIDHQQELEILTNIADLTKEGGLSIHKTRGGFPFSRQELQEAGFEVIEEGKLENGSIFLYVLKKVSIPTRDGLLPTNRNVTSSGV